MRAPQSRRAALISTLLAVIIGFVARAALAAEPSQSGARIFILMVWDGLRPDFVNERDTPNLFELARDGVRFDHHHAVFPTVTMVNAATLATGGLPGATGILGDVMYLPPALESNAANSIPGLGNLIQAPLNLEHSQYLVALNGRGAFDGRLVGVESVAQQVERAGGDVAILGKQGPTLLFDDTVADGSPNLARHNRMFIADDMEVPSASKPLLTGEPPMETGDLGSIGARDAWFTRLTIDKALPAAKRALSHGRSALLVLWQHNPDLVEHIAGLGTQPALNALHESDANLARIRTAIIALGTANAADLMIVSDHGFATIRMQVSLSDLLATAGIKKSVDSTEIVVSRNGGSDLIYLSRKTFTSTESRRATLARIVDFAEAQEWCGPIFSHPRAKSTTGSTSDNRLGWIPGTFSQELIGTYSALRSPDLIISFRESPDVNNHDLTGPENSAFELGRDGQRSALNHSYRLVRPIEGAVYTDIGSGDRFSTGMGMHGAAGARELHNFCAASGPDFRHRFVDTDPTGNADVAATIRAILQQAVVKGATGRVMREALKNGRHANPPPREVTIPAYLVIQGAEIVTTLRFTRFDGRDYLDDASLIHNSIGPPQ